jgi:hypothetical protein
MSWKIMFPLLIIQVDSHDFIVTATEKKTNITSNISCVIREKPPAPSGG